MPTKPSRITVTVEREEQTETYVFDSLLDINLEQTTDLPSTPFGALRPFAFLRTGERTVKFILTGVEDYVLTVS